MAGLARARRRRTPDLEEGESYYVSMTDMMVGVIFIFIIMLSYFALQFRQSTQALTEARHPETAALLQTATALTPHDVTVEVDEKARVLCVPEAVIGGTGTERRCFSYAPPARTAGVAVAASDAQKTLMGFLDADLRDAGAPLVGDTSGGALSFSADALFEPGASTLSPGGRQIAGQVAASLARRLPCLAYGGPTSTACPEGEAKLALVNVVSQTNLDAFTAEGQKAAALALARSAAFHQALTGAQPVLGALRNAPADQPGSQPLMRVASVGQSQEGASRVGEGQTVSIQFQMAQ
ncbi:hypothetical protein CFHF_00900 [Caulobacter flavus]|uniref:OmpA-like domain-containing protein n=1 Tax=Caulobacter flavus TaxID=1679497 RepID=A0A2N5D649_9CAUL|nr:hypothetical protein [Caulobacter flavus]AYV45917.1 hypothetical protein C1707_06445 [Caulobacter flavus]PLR21540.1 hypothetical protein CFHF_00900 [Caulobacter flavus]